MQGRKQSPFWGTLLLLISILYGAAIYVRRIFYGLHVFKRKVLSCPVISIGNITLGGTGKTPAVIQIAGLLSHEKILPVVVSRGYARMDEDEIVVVSDGGSILADAKTGGDEPVLIASKLFGVPVVVGKKKHQAALLALRRFKPGVVLLDDGFQHIQLQRDLDIVLVDAGNPFGNGKLFPKGILREPLAALKRAHAVLITKADSAGEVAKLKTVIQRHTEARIFTSSLVPVDLIDYRSGDSKPISSLRGTKVLALAGIARPASFFALLQSLGAEVVTSCVYPDHFDYQKTDLATVFRQAADAKINMIVTTEKDAVRIKDMHADGIWALRIELAVTEREEWKLFLLKGIGHA
jgi:tetraacyldisaccharide 4'-kinase